MADDIKFVASIVPQIDASNMSGGISQLQEYFNKLKLPPKLGDGFKDLFTDAIGKAEKFQDVLAKGGKDKRSFSELTRSADTALDAIDRIQKKMNSISDEQFLSNLEINPDIFKDVDRQIEETEQKIKESFEKLGKIDISGIEKARDALQQLSSSNAVGQIQQNFEKAFSTGDFSKIEDTMRVLISNMLTFGAAKDKVKDGIEQIRKSFTEGNFGAVSKEFRDLLGIMPKLNDPNITQGEEKLRRYINQVQILFNTFKNSKDLDVTNLTAKLDKLKESRENLEKEYQNNALGDFKQAQQGVTAYAQGMRTAEKSVRDTQKAQVDLNTEIGQLKNRIQHFFGLVNAVQLFRRALKDTFNTVKELDASMTETAVVTDFTVGDMWDQLPQYTATAKEFGATIKGVYDVMTLYYQQGLDQDTAWALGTETLKLARIAGLDYAEATDRMTNALRGFNMELNQQNAQRVGDVYSKLAAMSASNVDELSVAMTKTASIAKSANMEFETTAAFLAQIIETTREAPETAGTALKTVIARFSEVKDLYTKGQLTGEDSEGEKIDVNKVSEALGTASIDMSKYFTGEVGLDTIFMELAEKWDSLDLVQQRYIATQAAGSRQQSRFIAMLSDYGRTLELVEGAENANGASAQQFEKTQESLETKLNRLKDTWQEFSMGLANNQVIKGAVDALTKLLEIINKLTQGTGDFSSTFLKMGTLIGGFKGASSLFNKGIGKFAEKFGAGMAVGNGTAETAGQIAQPKTVIGRFRQRAQNFVAANQTKENARGFAAFKTNAEMQQYNQTTLAKKNERREALGREKKPELKTASETASTTALTVEATAAKADTEAQKELNTTRAESGQMAQQQAANTGVATAATEADGAAAAETAGEKQAEVVGREEVAGAAQTEAVAAQAAIQAKQAEITALQTDIGEIQSYALAKAETGELSQEEAISSLQAVSAKEAEIAVLQSEVAANSEVVASEQGKILADKLVERGIITKSQAEEVANAITIEGIGANTGLAAAETSVGTAAAGATGPIAAMGTALRTALAPILPIILAVGAGIGTIVAIAKGIEYSTSHTEKALATSSLETAKQDLENFEEKTKETQDSIDTLENSWESLTETNNNLSNLIQGTETFTQKVLEANQQVLELLDKLPELAQYLNIDNNTGLMSIDEQGYKKVLKEKQDQLIQNQTDELIASAHVAERQAKVNYLDDRNKLSQYNATLNSNQVKELENGVNYSYSPTTGKWYYTTTETKKATYVGQQDKEITHYHYTDEEQNAAIEKYLSSEEALNNENDDLRNFANDYNDIIINYEKSKSVANNTIKSAIMTSLANGRTNLSDNQLEANNVAATIMAGVYENELENQMSYFGNVSEGDIWQGGSTGAEFAKYAKEMGYAYDSASQVLRDSSGKDLYTIDFYGAADRDAIGDTKTITNEEAQRLFAKERAKQNINTRAKEISQLIAKNEYGEDLGKVFSGDLTADLDNAREMAKQLKDSDLLEDFDIDKRITDYDNSRKKINDKTVENINGIFKETIPGVIQYLTENEEGTGVTVINKKDIADTIGQSTISAISQGKQEIASIVGPNIDSGALQALYERQAAIGSLQNVSENQRVALAKSIFGEDLSLEELNPKIEESAHRAESLKQYISEINFNDAIGGAKQLKEDIEAGGEAATNAAAIIGSTDAFDSVAQITQLMEGENWGDISANLTEIYNSVGSINSDNVRELTSQYGDLGQMLDNGTMTASSFAAMMEDVAQSELTLGDITEDLIDLYNGFYGALDLAGDALAEFNKHQIRESRTQLGRGYTDSWAAVQDLIEKGAWGDVQMGDYMAQLVGTDTWEAALLEASGSQKEAVTNLNKLYGFDQNKGNLQGSWQHLLSNQDIEFTSGGGLTLTSDGQIAWDLTGIESSADLIREIAEQFQISDEYAKALVGDMQTFSENFSVQLAELDSGNAITNYLNKHLSEDGILKGTDKELAALAQKLGGKDATTDQLPELLKGKVKRRKEDGTEEEVDITTAKSIVRRANGFVEEETDKDDPTKKIQHINASEEDKTKAKEIQTNVKKRQAAVQGPIQVTNEVQEALKIPAVAQIVAADTSEVPNKEELLQEMGFDDGALINELISDDAVAAAQAQTATMANEMTSKIAGALDSITALLNQQELELKIGGGFGLDATFSGEGELGESLSGPAGTLQFKPNGGTITIGANPSNYTGIASSYSAPSGNGEGSYEYTGENGKKKGGKSTYGKNDDTGSGGGGGGGGSGDSETTFSDKEAKAINEELEKEDQSNRISNAVMNGVNAALDPYSTGVTAIEQAGVGDYIGTRNTINEALQNPDETNYIEEITTAIQDGTGSIRDAIQELKETGTISDETLKKLPGSINGAETSGALSNYSIETVAAVANEQQEKFNQELEVSNKRLERLKRLEQSFGKSQAATLALQTLQTAELIKQFKTTKQKYDYNKKAFFEERDNFNKNNKYKDYVQYDDMGNKKYTDKYWNSGTEKRKQVNEDKGVRGMDILAGNFSESISGMLEGGLGIFDMGMSIFETGKGMFDTMKGYAEKIAQYITQAIEVVVSAWTNRKDWLYNFLNRIEKELHEFEKLQEYANQIDEGRVVSYQELMKNWDDQFESLQKQLEMQNERIEARQQYLDWSKFIPFTLISGWSPVTDTLYENRTVKFMWDLMIGFGQMVPMFGDVFKSLDELYKDYDKRVQENYEDRLEAEKAILEIETERLKLVKAGAEEATQFEEKVMDAFIQKEQEAIDELSRLNEAITGANQTLLDTLKDNLEQVRRIRENTDKEEDLTDKEIRLAYLRQDTSNANLNEIKKLEKELEKDNESYTDKLIDQRIDDLSKQNEDAATQRQKQIDLLQGQLDWAEKYGVYWDHIYGMLYTVDEYGNIGLNQENFDERGFLRANGELSKMLNTFSDLIGESIWKTLMDNEELKKLGVYYNAFVQYNGNEGIWRRQDMLQNPDINDNGYVSWWADKNAGPFWQFFAKIEDDWHDFWMNNDLGLWNDTALALKKVADFFLKIWGWITGQTFESKADAWIKEGGFKSERDNTPFTEFWFKLFNGMLFNRAATGTDNASTGDWLVGEEGPELIQFANGGAYLAGTHGPEMVPLSNGDKVYNNSDTKQIFSRGPSFGRLATGNATLALTEPKWIEDLFERGIKEIGNLTKNTAENNRTIVNEVHLNIENMNGDRQSAEDAAQIVIDRLDEIAKYRSTNYIGHPMR